MIVTFPRVCRSDKWGTAQAKSRDGSVWGMRRLLGIFVLIALLTACDDATRAPTATQRGSALPESVSVTATPTTPTTTSRTATPATAAGSASKNKGTPQPTRRPTLTPTTGPTIVFTAVQGGRPSDTASAAIKGPPNTNCTIAYFTPSRTRSQAPGLAPMMTDTNGIAVWTWTIAQSTRPGTGHLDVTCGKLKGSARITISK
jgi:hypothetical protein